MAPYNLAPNEHVTLQSRRHIVNYFPAAAAGIAMLLAAAGSSYLGSQTQTLGKQSIPSGIFNATAIILVAVGLLVLVVGWWVYRRNLLVLTNMHLIKVEQMGLFSRKTSQLSLDRVQDVDGTRQGIFGTVLDYGAVEVETASEQEHFIFIQMPRPTQMASELVEAHDAFTNRGGQGLGAQAASSAPAAATDAMQIPSAPAPASTSPKAPAEPAPVQPEPQPPQAPTPPTPESPTIQPPPPSHPTGPQPLIENQPVELDGHSD